MAPAHDVRRPLRKSLGVGFDSDSVLCRVSSENLLIHEFGNSNEPRGLAGIHETTQHKILLERKRTSVGNSDSRINPNRQGATRSSIERGTRKNDHNESTRHNRRPVWCPVPCATVGVIRAPAAPSLFARCLQENKMTRKPACITHGYIVMGLSAHAPCSENSSGFWD